MEDRNSVFSKDELRTFLSDELHLLYEAKHITKNPNALFEFWREKKKLFSHRVFERGYKASA